MLDTRPWRERAGGDVANPGIISRPDIVYYQLVIEGFITDEELRKTDTR